MKKQPSIRDIVKLQETNYTVRIQPPGAESFELQVLLNYHHYLLKYTLLYLRVFLSLSVSPPLSGVRTDAGGGAAPGADGSRDHLPPHLFLPPAARHHAPQPGRGTLCAGLPGWSSDQGGGG